MPDMMASAAAWFEQQRTRHLVVGVRYHRPGDSHGIACRATLGIGKWEAIDQTGQVVRIETRDFIVADAELGHVPTRGDTIVVEENGIERTYKVIVPDGSKQAWRWVDRNQAVRRIHTLEAERYPGA